MFAEFFKFQPFFKHFFVLPALIVHALAFCTFKFDELFLRHSMDLIWRSLANKAKYVNKYGKVLSIGFILVEKSAGFQTY